MSKVMLFCTSLLATSMLWAGGAEWIEDIEAAQEMAKAKNRPILVNFTGSDWCGWCKRLDREVFSQNEFASFAKENLVLLKVDFPKYRKLSKEKMRQNYAFANKYGVMGYPTIYLMDSSGRTILKTGYVPGGAERYIQHLTEAMN